MKTVSLVVLTLAILIVSMEMVRTFWQEGQYLVAMTVPVLTSFIGGGFIVHLYKED